ncbi:uncharacterized protein N7515_008686 [Penicillium bovifimosum]|uniref:Uncharacterized protein n=1 Tax=Penicillium bovifimosum TaxID=126998 RepID=A0A9W9GNG8_9EURO|nr:uncharacterized protein N7515_008686 [Penicillium bovifimosum]KAJ5124861.1 hypothetical protein N7515_008686 [Penicillium bovifimosum]
MPVRRQREDVFPIPPQTPTPQRLNLTRREVFGSDGRQKQNAHPGATLEGGPSCWVHGESPALSQSMKAKKLIVNN